MQYYKASSMPNQLREIARKDLLRFINKKFLFLDGK